MGPQSATTRIKRQQPVSAGYLLMPVLVCLTALLPASGPVLAQNDSAGRQPRQIQNAPARTLSPTLPDAALSGILERKGNLTLRDMTIVEALFVLREQWKVDMVIASDIEGQVNATFNGASLREILDSLLLSRGYGYQIVGRSVVILPLQELSGL